MSKGSVAVIGAGASGMVAAIGARKAGANVTCFDTNPNPGKKLLKTGNGKCNFTNADLSFSHYHGNSPEYVKSIIGAFGLSETLELVKEWGIEPKCVNGLYYPYSLQAKSFRDCLFNELTILGVTFVGDSKVVAIRRDGDGFVIETAQGRMPFDGVILACGGVASPETGSDGNGYMLAQNLGHSIIKPLPALCPIGCDDHFLREAKGIRIDTGLTANIEGKKYKEEGNLQITEYGISGICTMQLSTHISPALDAGKEVIISLDFLPDKKSSEIKGLLEARFKTNGRSKSAATALLGLLPDKLSVCVLKKSHIPPQTPAINVKGDYLKELINNIKNYTFKALDVRGFNAAQSTLGGINLKETDKKTLESKLVKGLYFCGEILDVCGDCGGYNLQWAISSGFVAGKSCGEGL